MAKYDKPMGRTAVSNQQHFLYSLLMIFTTFGYALGVIGISFLLQRLININQPLILLLLVLALAIVLYPLRTMLEKALSKLFYQAEESYDQHLNEISVNLTTLTTPEGIAEELTTHIDKTLHPETVFVFLLNEDQDAYHSVSSNVRGLNTEITFPISSELVNLLEEQESVFIDLSEIPSILSEAQARIKLIDCNLFIALPNRQSNGLLGWVALKRQDNREFSPAQVNFLQTISRQSAIAIERNSVVENLESRAQEMEVLNAISEGVNLTLELNDILELLYFQTTKIIPASEFMIQLFDQDMNALLNLFIVRDFVRIQREENTYIPCPSTFQRILSIGETFVAKNYSQEVEPGARQEIYGWIGTPLKTSDETIGIMSIGSRNPDYEFTLSQRRLMESIAGQASGAIIKTRLLEETNRRAMQFSALNEVTQQITSTFNVDFLLQTIVERAEAMLDCEASSLLLFDEEKKDLYFRVVTGPVADKLINQPIERNRGISWTTVNEKRPIISNKILQSEEWNEQIDVDTGFQTDSMLTAPLMTQGEVIGVIETINKRNKQPFNEVDQEILEAFAGQAAIAIENAQLYTQTDQALSERVEELSIMQNIDRELNTSLDIERAMQITLDNAMLRSHADAAFIGSLGPNNEKVHIVAAEGYQNESEPLKDQILDVYDFDHLRNAVESGTTESVIIRTQMNSVLAGCKRQTIIPITRENTAIGVLVLESYSDEPIPENTMDFLIRLCDHASIAIANAELYTQVQNANVAKSEFVSFVSHELKNPMTSIKGYTDLLIAQAVGPVSEPQANFLQTIRSNVERMNVLVSDLSDESRIEAGRMRLDFVELDLQNVLDEVIRSQKGMIENKNQTITINLQETLPHIWADRVRVVQILANLISNANKYTPENGEIIFSAEQSANVWNTEGAPQVVHIAVKDNGMGISEEDQRKIFQKFFRTESAKSSDAPGTGLGLNITKNLTEMQGGQIWFESEVGHGTTFHVTFPIAA
jgi:K+-sensing histidine kinase KdpD